MMQITKLSETSFIEVGRNVLPIINRNVLDAMVKRCPETSPEIQMFGKMVKVPRKTALFGEASYKFSGVRMQPEEDMPELVVMALAFANKQYPAYKWSGALVNWYMTGDDYIGAHSDDESDLAKGAPILSFSFGAERTFRIKPKVGFECAFDKKDIPTAHNSMIAMCGDMQSQFKHEVPKSKKVHTWRINITVRAF